MIDFRYHLVSLISVFLALAVGIILGAGPLQGAIGDQLTDQVDALRTERNDLRDELSATQVEAERRLEFLQAAGPQLVAGTLEGSRVAVVDLDDVAGDVQQGVRDQVEAAGGTVTLGAVLLPAWTDTEHAGFRDTIAGGLRERLAEAAPDLPEDASTEQTLAAALAVALTGAEAPGVRSQDAIALEQQLVQANLVDVREEQGQPADAVLLMSGVTAVAEPGETPEPEATPEADAVSSMVALAQSARLVAPAVVLAGPTPTSDDVLSALRAEADAAREVSTVSGIETPVGRFVVPLALAAQLGGQVGQYGFEDGTTPLPLLPRPLPAPAGADGAAAEGAEQPGETTEVSADVATDGGEGATEGEG
ncbi:copper transporter [Xylanimonas oleitrophica]|uniref:copper transporter n=1 Tax=Xylanimonas oleitrophica TaxID=2607479 RepID=UPI0015CFE96E|nr:copper transporter [Xylanimonas oleitrophica]